jgi:hypothetical protein
MCGVDVGGGVSGACDAMRCGAVRRVAIGACIGVRLLCRGHVDARRRVCLACFD